MDAHSIALMAKIARKEAGRVVPEKGEKGDRGERGPAAEINYNKVYEELLLITNKGKNDAITEVMDIFRKAML